MGAISCAYLVPATQNPWGPLTPNNPLTSHLNREERLGVMMATAGVARVRAGVVRTGRRWGEGEGEGVARARAW
jgi:hypothetical protein